MRTFEMIRREDETGISGIGTVAEGVVFTDGSCVLRWTSKVGPGNSTTFFDSFGLFLSIHVTSHPSNNTEIRFNDGTVYVNGVKQEPLEEPKVKRTRKRKEAVTNGR